VAGDACALQNAGMMRLRQGARRYFVNRRGGAVDQEF